MPGLKKKIVKYKNLQLYFAIVIKYKNLIEKVVNIKLVNLYLEFYINDNRIDMVGTEVNGSHILGEITIRDSATDDYTKITSEIERLVDIIARDEFVTIIIIAPQFSESELIKITDYIKSYNIKIIFLTLSNELVTKVKNYKNPKDINKYLEENLELFYFKEEPQTNVNRDKPYRIQLDGQIKGNSMANGILNALQENIKWYNPIHTFKNLYATKNKIKIGTGTSDILIIIDCDMEYVVKFEVNFGSRYDVYGRFLNNINDMSKYIGYELQTGNKKSALYFDMPVIEKEEIFCIAVHVVEKFLEYLHNMYQKMDL